MPGGGIGVSLNSTIGTAGGLLTLPIIKMSRPEVHVEKICFSKIGIGAGVKMTEVFQVTAPREAKYLLTCKAI